MTKKANKKQGFMTKRRIRWGVFILSTSDSEISNIGLNQMLIVIDVKCFINKLKQDSKKISISLL